MNRQSRKVLEARDDKTINQTSRRTQDFNNQLWKIEPAAENQGAFFTIVAHSGEAIDIPGGQGEELQLYPFHGGDNQQWDLNRRE